MPTVDREEGADEPSAAKSSEGGGKGKSVEDKRNAITPNGSKRKRKDWRAFASANGGVRRRFLRSDMAKLLAETEAKAAKEAGTRFNLVDLEGAEWVKCADGLQIANGKVGKLNGKINKESNEYVIGSVTGKEVTDIANTEHLGNGELGAGERKKGDDAAIRIAESDFPSENEEALEGKGKADMENLLVTREVSDKTGNENIQCDTKKVDASCNSSKGVIKAENTKVKEEATDVQGEEAADAEEIKTEDKKVNVLKEAKEKLSAAKKQTPVKVESVNVERRITRSSAAKQKVNDENVPKNDVARAVLGQMEEESSGLDQANADDKELLKNIKLKTNKKTISDRRKSSDLTDSDEDFNSSKKRVRKKQAKVEEDRNGSVSLGTKLEPSMTRKKLKMDKKDLEEDAKVIKGRDQQRKREVESEGSDSLGCRTERLRKKKEPEVSEEDSSSNSDYLGSEEETPATKKRRGKPPVSKHRSGKAKFSEMTKKKKKKHASPLGSKNKKNVIKVESLSELDDKPRKVAKDIVSNMIKDLLKNHGWTIDMRPRNGRDYYDQVHVSPDGTTHWSITKAYYSFLQKRESKNAVDFTPIPEELLVLLKRTVCNERCDARKTKKPKGKKKNKTKWLGVKSKKIKKKIKNEGETSTSNDINKMDVGLTPASKKSNPGRSRKKKARLTLLARQSHNEGDAGGENDYVPYEWKRTILSWMIDLDVVSENGKVKYIDPTKPGSSAEGKISRDGIQCHCCGKCFTVFDFGVHIGAESGSSFLACLFVEDAGLHFLQCLVRAWEKQCSISEPKGFFLSAEAKGVDQNDDTCGVCGDGGDLVCCDKCPSTFHLGCLGMEMPPSGDWHCPYCSCGFCMKLSSFPLLSCNQCNDKFHSSCVSEKHGAYVGQDEGISFCGGDCKKLYEGLEAMLGVSHMIEGGFSWRLVRHITEDEYSMGPVHPLEVRAECNAKVAVAMAVMDECFLPIDDQRSGIDLLQNVVYNCKSNFVRLNFRGFYTFLLERDDEIICVASVRVHGNKLAEMPFIGTRYMYRRQGMCRHLLDGIEMALSSLKVEKLIIPAITELVDTWTNVFGFRPLEGPERQELRSKSIVVFPHTGLLQKPMLGTSSKEDCKTYPTEGDGKILGSPKNQQLSNGDVSPEFADASCADIKPDDSGEKSSYATASEEGDLAAASNPDADVVQSVMCGGGSAELNNNMVQYGGKLCDKPAEVDSDPMPAVQSHEGSVELKSGTDLVNDTHGKTKVLSGVDKISPLGCEENGRLQGCAENGVHHLAGPQTTSTDAVMASAAN